MTFREKLLALRRRDNLTQTALARAVGVTRQSVYMWEKGQSYPEAEALLALRRLFGVSIDALLDDGLPLPEGREIGSRLTAPTAGAERTAPPKGRPENAGLEDHKTKIAKTPSKSDETEPPAPRREEAPPPLPETPPDEQHAPLRAKIEPSRVKSGNILDLFGSFLRRRK